PCLKRDRHGEYWLVSPFTESQFQALRQFQAFQEPIYEKEDYLFFAPFRENQLPVVLFQKSDQEWTTKDYSVDLVEKLGWLKPEDFQIITPCLEKKGEKWHLKKYLKKEDLQKLIKVFHSLKLQDNKLFLFPANK
ncbi:MAG: hypothetical protein ACFFBD_12355, partial [Candidatus Hodarchaeota archaeon]